MQDKDNFPVIIGVGQIVDHWTGEDINTAPHPVEIVKQAVDAACKDSGIKGIKSHIDCAAIVRIFPDSLPFPFHPFGKVESFPAALISRSDINPDKIIYSSAGGEQPQALVANLSQKLFNGEIGMALIAGGEVTGALKTAMKKGLKLDWTDDSGSKIKSRVQDMGAKTDFISDYEIKNGLGMPPQTYAAMEQALRARLNMSTEEYRAYISQIFSNLSKVAQTHPYAQFPQFRSAEFLAQASPENYPAFEPYLKWHMAQDAVNQSAALILTTAGKARALGVPAEKFIYLHGHSNVEDSLVSKRPDLSRSQAIELTLSQTLESSGLTASEVTHFDIYSCFPIVVHLAAEHLGLDPLNDTLSVTGGLPFFGGAGNNYSTHGIASLVETLRANAGDFGLVLANGGFISKQAAGIYSTRPPQSWAPVSSAQQQAVIDNRPDIVMLDETCQARIEAYCLKHGRSGLEGGYIIARNDKGRILANIDPEDKATLEGLLAKDDAVGARVKISHQNGRNIFSGSIP